MVGDIRFRNSACNLNQNPSIFLNCLSYLVSSSMFFRAITKANADFNLILALNAKRLDSDSRW